MNIVSLTIENFLTIGEAQLNLKDRGLLLLQGENEDDPSASSNGAGKSSIPDALCWAIYGTTARGVSGDAVVNKTAKKECRVTVEIEDGKNRYEIARHRKSSRHKNAVMVYCINEKAETIDITKGTDKETQVLINQIMGCSYEVFSAAIYAGQEKMPDLPAMTDKQLKLLIEESAGVEILAAAYELARSKANSQSARVNSALAEVGKLESQIVNLKDDYIAAYENSKKYEDEKFARAKDIVRQVHSLSVERDKLTLKISEAAGFEKEKEEIKKIEIALDSVRVEKEKLAALEKAEREADRKMTALNNDKIRTAKNVLALKERVREIADLVGKPCGECGKEYCEHDLEDARKAREAAVALELTNLARIDSELKSAKKTHEQTKQAISEFKDTMTDVVDAHHRWRELSEIVSQEAQWKDELAEKDRAIEEAKRLARATMLAENPYKNICDGKAIHIATQELNLANAKDVLKLESEQLSLVEDAVKVFGPAGVRAHILDTVTPFLNDRTSDYLSALADGNLHAVWTTLTKNAKGELREKFMIEVTNDKGAESFMGLSGGEKRKVRLACAMALQDLVATRASKPINLFVADEVDHALDENGLERLMTVLDRKARERGTVLVISHNSLSDWIPDVLTVRKSGGLSVVEE